RTLGEASISHQPARHGQAVWTACANRDLVVTHGVAPRSTLDSTRRCGVSRTWSAQRGRPTPGRVGAGALLWGLLLVSACGTQTGAGPGDSPGGDPATATGGIAGFPACTDVPRIRADESLYREAPVYGNADELV